MQASMTSVPVPSRRLGVRICLALLLSLGMGLSGAILAQPPVAMDRVEQAELDQILAPIALYPDPLLAHILMASTYPLDVVEAARWSAANPEQGGTAAVEAVAGMAWDPSVKALVAFPEVLARMSENLRWMRRLGELFAADEQGVSAAIQALRERADNAGNLGQLEHTTVHRQNNLIIIQARQPRHIHIPYYNPALIYGAWHWPAYPPVYWRPRPGYQLDAGFHWGGAVHLSGSVLFSTFDWHRRHIVVFNPRLKGATLTTGRYPVGYYHSRGYYRDPRRHGYEHWRHRPDSRWQGHRPADHRRNYRDAPAHRKAADSHPGGGRDADPRRYSPTGSYLRPPIRLPAGNGPHRDAERRRSVSEKDRPRGDHRREALPPHLPATRPSQYDRRRAYPEGRPDRNLDRRSSSTSYRASPRPRPRQRSPHRPSGNGHR